MSQQAGYPDDMDPYQPSRISMCPINFLRIPQAVETRAGGDAA